MAMLVVEPASNRHLILAFVTHARYFAVAVNTVGHVSLSPMWQDRRRGQPAGDSRIGMPASFQMRLVGCLETRGRRTADLNLTRFHGLGDNPLQLDAEQAVL